MIDKIELRRWWDTFVGDGNFTEIRILGKFQYSGYFKSFDNLCKQLEPYTEMEDEQIYFVLNRIDDSCYARPQCEKFLKSVKVSTNDNDIISRRFVMIDCDAIRKSSVNSSESEYQFAIEKTREIFRFLRNNNFPDPIVCVSGNGGHLQIPVDLPNDEETTEILKRFYKYLGQQFTDEHVDIDQKVFNLARLCKTYSTLAKKGANLPERPWRQSKILYVPKELKNSPIELFKKIADMLPVEDEQISAKNVRLRSSGERFDLENWLNTYGIEYRKKQEGSSVKYEIKTCPWHETHSSNNPYSSALFQDADGKITYTCAHAHCQDKQWKDFRIFYQPDAYDRPVYTPNAYYQRATVQQKQKYSIKEESAELGKKWLSMSDIEKVDLSAMERVKTGFTELDSAILGLTMTEVTLLSGGNGSGKSSILNTLLCNFIQQGFKTALWSGELPAPILKTWIQMVAAGRNHLRPSSYGDGKYYVPNNVSERIDRWFEGNLFLFNNEYGSVFEEIKHDMLELLKLGVKVFILDNLFSLDIDLLEGDKNNKQKELILQIKEFAKKHHVHIILVAHPRKSLAFLRKNDISGTADLTNAVDNVWICHRVNQDFFKSGADFYGQSTIQRFRGYGTVIEICKNRMFGVVDLMVGLYYEIESRRFKNYPEENIMYGWEREPSQTEVQYYTEPSESENAEIPFGEELDNAPF